MDWKNNRSRLQPLAGLKKPVDTAGYHGFHPWLPMKSAPSRGARGYEFHLRYPAEYVTVFTPRSAKLSCRRDGEGIDLSAPPAPPAPPAPHRREFAKVFGRCGVNGKPVMKRPQRNPRIQGLICDAPYCSRTWTMLNTTWLAGVRTP